MLGRTRKTSYGKITVGIEGMACGMCEAVRNAFQVKKVTSSHTKKQTVIIAEKDIPEQELKNAVAKAGYDAVPWNDARLCLCVVHEKRAEPNGAADFVVPLLPYLLSFADGAIRNGRKSR